MMRFTIFVAIFVLFFPSNFVSAQQSSESRPTIVEKIQAVLEKHKDTMRSLKESETTLADARDSLVKIRKELEAGTFEGDALAKAGALIEEIEKSFARLHEDLKNYIAEMKVNALSELRVEVAGTKRAQAMLERDDPRRTAYEKVIASLNGMISGLEKALGALVEAETLLAGKREVIKTLKQVCDRARRPILKDDRASVVKKLGSLIDLLDVRKEKPTSR